MITCPNCAWRNPDGSRFCENCGADLEALNRTAARPQTSWPEPPATSQRQEDGDDDPSSPEWRMAPLPPEEAVQSKRRIWVWLLVFALMGCLVICVAGFVWLDQTDSGRNFQTRVAEEESVSDGN